MKKAFRLLRVFSGPLRFFFFFVFLFFFFFFFFFAIQNIYVNSKPATVNFEHVIVGWILTKKTAVDEII